MTYWDGKECRVDVGKQVSDLLHRFGLTQGDLASKLGCSKQHISMVCKNERGLSTDQLKKLIDEFRVDARFFFGGVDDIEDAVAFSADAPTRENMIRRIAALEAKVRPAGEMDSVLEQVNAKRELREIVEKIAHLESNTLRQIDALVFAYLYRGSHDASERDQGAESA